ncbi:5-(carboxyamino)imidazole ribonucleotide synthase [Geodermatophilus sp. YIM 151500]|uniref:5-(carboxyamino)imidazole ribonucleotide synthase n=1 Tax=Geodermatophilus sp. YIM 151500 TaxID=2984531 RepID=UPI0021E50C2E|nr:5-(carboxyamino)imidazole ribonucleotide synthase [Geodermatophilus sp. YIM 151500]MCV2488551.1 5-(carboxyamino)imidazole ribonucleotide synthase [Geodermatophilus sp. YIM 151500]
MATTLDRRTGLPVVAMVGGGQLARMTHQAAIALGLSLRVLSAGPDESAALVAADVQLGDHRDLDALRRAAAGATVLTFDHEHVPTEHLRALEGDGHRVAPGPAALVHAQDKLVLRRALHEAGEPQPAWAEATAVADVEAFAAGRGWPVVLKTPRGGYDGKGVFVVHAADEAADLLAAHGRLLVEERVAMVRELAVQVARSPFGQVAVWPVVETVQRGGVCHEVLAPAPGLDDERASAAQRLAVRLADRLGVVGLLAVELFETADGVLVNELAMRPHNSGHWTMEGARTGQFEQHLRAVLDYPLGSTAMTAPVVVMANVLGGAAAAADWAGPGLDERVHHLMAHWPDVKLHWYGKGQRPGRKLGHVTALGDDLAEVRARAVAAARYLADGVVDPVFAFGDDAVGHAHGAVERGASAYAHGAVAHEH